MTNLEKLIADAINPIKLAECAEVMMNAMLSAKEQNHIYEASADIEIALAECEKIAGE